MNGLLVFLSIMIVSGCAIGAHSERIGPNRYNITGSDDIRSFHGNAEENFIFEAKRVCPNGFKILERRTGRRGNVVGSIECE